MTPLHRRAALDACEAMLVDVIHACRFYRRHRGDLNIETRAWAETKAREEAATAAALKSAIRVLSTTPTEERCR